MPSRTHLILLGGFLGSGKTTAAACLACYLAEQGLRAGLITNDQGGTLVDTAALQSRALPVEEIAHGCFCCRFDDLVGAAERLSCAGSPDVLIAEAVGSCTDLIATVANPLQKLYSDRYTVAPLSVLVDPIQARRILGLDSDAAFSQDVRYIYRKQLEEAGLIIVNKSELLIPASLEELRSTLAAAFPAAEVQVVSVRLQQHLEPWFERLVFGKHQLRRIMDLDYGRYASGEACLAWLNASLGMRASTPLDPDAFLLRVAEEIHRGLNASHAEVAHLKLSLQAADRSIPGAAVVNLVRGDLAPELGWRLGRSIEAARILINLRAETAPEILEAVLTNSLSRIETLANGLRLELDRLECFRPAPPVPTHRVELSTECV